MSSAHACGTSAISADSHVCSGLLSWVEKQLRINKRKQSAYTWDWPLSKWHEIALSLFLSLSPTLSISFTVKWCCIIQPTISGEMLRLQQKTAARSSEINARYSAREQSLSLRGLGRVFILQAAISSRSLHTSLRNPIKMTDYILSPQGLSFTKIYKSSPIIRRKKERKKEKKIGEICRTINLVWCVLLKLRYSVEQLKTVNSPVLLPLHKRIRQLICITAHIYSNLSSFCVRCCSASSRCCYPSQQAGSGSLPPPPAASSDTGKTCFTLDLCHYPTPASQGNRGIKAGQEKSCPHT